MHPAGAADGRWIERVGRKRSRFRAKVWSPNA
jgi:hypothetical protein